MPGETPRVLITGANGHIGRRLIARLERDRARGVHDVPRARALVRSQRAGESLQDLAPPELVVCDYADTEAMKQAAAGCRYVVHLVGILKQARGASYEAAHQDACRALEQAASDAGVERIVYLSIFGASHESQNPCLASKAQAERILLQGAVPTTVLRVPMVIGPEDHASAALRAQSRSRLLPLLGGGRTMQQPIDVRDVVGAILAALEEPSREMLALDLGGPERLTHKALVRRAAALHGRRPLVLPIPLALGRGFAALCERVFASPPITRPMLDILQHDDRIDEALACERLGIRLTPFDDTLRRFVGPESAAGVAGQPL